MKKNKSIIFILSPIDFIVIVFYSMLTILNIVYFDRVQYAGYLIGANFLLFLFVFFVAYSDNQNKSKIWLHIHRWYIAPLILLSFKELYLMIKPIRMIDYDSVLISIDRFIFGTDPTVFLYKFANPVLTEILQIAYSTFFFLPIILGIELLLKHKTDEFYYATFLVLYGFFLSYIGYILVPAIGPRFTLHDFHLTNKELPGLFLTNFLREVINSGESIPNGTLNPAEVVQRDVFPSGHTQMTLIVMYLAYKFNVKLKYFFWITGSLLIIATVYLRYHYVIDLIGGAVFMWFTIWSGYYLYNWWQKLRGEKEFRYN